MRSINMYCDASVGPDLKGACAGVKIIGNGLFDDTFVAVIQPNGTNNSGEILAICLAVLYAMKLNPYNGEFLRFNIFSDSLISIRGVREWIPNWIRNMDQNGILFNSSGKEVKNQYYYKFIYNNISAIGMNNYPFNIRFYHQDGHITSNFDQIIPRFRTQNGIYLADLGLTPTEVCVNNDFVDKNTRQIINNYLMNGDTGGYPIEMGPVPSDFIKIIDTSEDNINRYLNIIGMK